MDSAGRGHVVMVVVVHNLIQGGHGMTLPDGPGHRRASFSS